MSYKYTDEGKKKHYHELDGKPLIGTSSVSSVIAKPLTWWALQVGLAKLGFLPEKKRQGKIYKPIPKEERIEAALKGLTEIQNMTPIAYLARLDEAYKAHDKVKNEAAVTGTDLHAVLERYVKACIEKNNGLPLTVDLFTDEGKRIEPFVTWALKSVRKFLWSEVHCYSAVHWLGGISDCGYETYAGGIGIMDFKSSKEAYDEQFWQAAGYDIEISENGGFDKDGNLIFKLEKPITEYAILPFGAEDIEPVFRYNVTECKELFLAELKIYKAKNT